MILKEKNLFTKEECDSIIWEETKNITNHSYMVDRKYYSQQIGYNENTKWLFDKLTEFFQNETELEIFATKNKIHCKEY